MVCPNRDTGALSIRAATYDIESANANLYVDEQILFSELQGSWNWVYAGYSEAQGLLSVVIYVARTDRVISFQVNAKHFDDTEKIYLEVGYDGYLPALQASFYDIRFSWGPTDGEFNADAESAHSFFQREYQTPEDYQFDGVKSKSLLISENWSMDT